MARMLIVPQSLIHGELMVLLQDLQINSHQAQARVNSPPPKLNSREVNTLDTSLQVNSLPSPQA
jgi:hypothetical protein